MSPARRPPTPTAAVASATGRQRARAAEIEAALDRARRGVEQATRAQAESRDRDRSASARDLGAAASDLDGSDDLRIIRRAPVQTGKPAIPDAQRRQRVAGGVSDARAVAVVQTAPSGTTGIDSARAPTARGGDPKVSPRPAGREPAFGDTGGIQLPGLVAPVGRGSTPGPRRPATREGVAPPRARSAQSPGSASQPKKRPRGVAGPQAGPPAGLRPVDTTGQTARVVDDGMPPTMPSDPVAVRSSRSAPVRRHRPQATLAVAWVALTAGFTLVGGPPLAAWMALAAAAAAGQVASSTYRTSAAQPVTAALGAATICVASAFGSGALSGAALAMLVMMPIAYRVRGGAATAGMVNTTLAGIALGLAGGSVALIRAEDPMLALLLWLFLWMHDSAAFVLGSGRAPVIGGLAGVFALAPVALLASVVAPFHGGGAWILAGAAAVAIACGVVLARWWTLPTADLRQTRLVPPAVGRLDSLLVTGPVWVALIWWVL